MIKHNIYNKDSALCLGQIFSFRLKHKRSSPPESCPEVSSLIPVVLTDEVWESPLCCVFSLVSKLDMIDFGLNSFLGRLLAVDILQEQIYMCINSNVY